MKEKVRKYFMAGTDEEVLMGDVISQELEKDFKDGRKLTREVEFELNEETVPFALEMGIIEEKDEDDLIDFNDEEDEGDGFDFRDAVCADIEELAANDRAFEKKIKKLEARVASIEELCRLLQPNKEEAKASSKKK
jgi:hypothetical protein